MNSPNLDLTGSRILVVDDVPENINVLTHALEEANYQVQIATNGRQALDVAMRSQPDLILLDIMMPGIDGYETCQRLKAEATTQHIPVIFLTALDELSKIVEGFRVGGVDYMTKPFQQEEVLARIRTHLERAKLAAELELLVLQRTQELSHKVKELEGKDRITQHLLSLHTLEDTLNLTLETITNILDLNKAVIYLAQNDSFQPAAGIGISEPQALASADQLAQIVPSETVTKAMNTLASDKISQNITDADTPFALIPIVADDELLGLIEVDKRKEPIEESEIQTLTSFALQAAIAIKDAQIQQNNIQWNDKVEEVFDLDTALSDSDQLDSFNTK